MLLYINRKEKITPQYVQEFIDNQKINGIKDSTIYDQTSKLLVIDEWKPLNKWKKDDVTKYILYMKDKGLADSSIEMVKSILKKYFVFHNMNNYVEDLKIKLPTKKLKSTDILNPEDINKLIEVADTNLEKAFIALLFESGARISEILKLKVKDIQETEKGMHIDIPGTKTGEDYRPCLCVYSGQYIRNHVLYPSLKPEDNLFNISTSSAQRILAALKKKSGITKPLTAHKFRHAQATYMVRKGYNESVIRQKLGWTGDSKMIARYQHIDGNDVLNATAEKETGVQVQKELIRPINMAEPIRIADPTIELNRIQRDNEELQQKFIEQNEENQRLHEELQITKYEHEQDLQAMDAELQKIKQDQIAFYRFMKAKYGEKV